MVDAVSLEVFRNLFASIAEEMGTALQRTAYSPNIKERRDFSCAIFDDNGRMVAQAAHIPVHLGAMPEAVAMARQVCSMHPGDIVVLNDPYLGGTHLPDITMVSRCGGEPGFYVASRRPPCRRWRHESGLDADRQRGVPGRLDHPTGQAR